MTQQELEAKYPNAEIGEDALIGPGAEIRQGYEGIVIYDLYDHSAGCYYDFARNEIVIRLGCYHRTIEEWEADFYNNPGEFPEGAPQTAKRWEAFNYCKSWALENLQPDKLLTKRVQA